MVCQHRDRNVPTITGEGRICGNPDPCPEHAPRCGFFDNRRFRCRDRAEPGEKYCRGHLVFFTPVKSEPPPSMVEILIDAAEDLDQLKDVLKRHFRGEF